LNNALAWAAKDLFANVGLVGKENGLWALDDDAGMLADYEAKFGPVIPTQLSHHRADAI